MPVDATGKNETSRFSVSDARAGLRLSLGTSWKAARLDTVALVVLPLAVSLIPAVLALALRGLVNAVVAETAGDDPGRYGWEFYVWLSFFLALVVALATSINAYFLERHIEALDHHVGIGVLEHAQTLDFAYFEDPRFQDTIRQAGESPGLHVQDVLVKGIRSASALITITSLLIVLARIELRLIFYVVPLSIPFMLQRWWIGRLRYETQVAQNRSRRWVGYFSGQLTAASSLPEARVLGIAPLFIGRANDRLSTMRSENDSVYRKQALSSGLFNGLAVLAVYAALLTAVRRAVDGELSVGDIAVFAAAATAVRTAIELLFNNLSSLRWHFAHMQQLGEFLALPARHSQAVAADPVALDPSTPAHTPATPAATAEESAPLVAIRDVSFTYPASSAPVLDGFDLDIHAGETVALVGRNGSGKSTLVKLLAGLYRPDRGTVSVNGVRTDTADLRELRDQMSIVFQSFGQYNATLGENIAMGDLDRLLGDSDAIAEIGEWAGLGEIVASLPDGYDTLLGREFGDVSLSGGQWQRLAIARAFAHRTPLMVLDEPTANLDPEAEFEVFQRFAELAQGRATLLISHRFSTISLADRIAVIDEGSVTEVGTHAELIDLDGTYADLYRMFRAGGNAGSWSE